MATRRHFPPWADLRPELVGLIIGRLPLADRIRLGAVCRPWRGTARQEPQPPPLPWLPLLGGAFLSVPGGEIHRMPVPEDASYYGSMGNWLLLKNSSSGEFSLMNPFSEDIVRLPTETCPARPTSVKPVPLLTTLDDDDLSPDSPFAILTTDSRFESVISVCRPGTSSTDTAFRVPDGELRSDVAFFDEKLYAPSLRKLYVPDLETGGSSSKGKQPPRARVPSMRRVADAVKNPGFMCRTIAGKC
ncbi:unnamed protein product [Urochloa humidicola]